MPTNFGCLGVLRDERGTIIVKHDLDDMAHLADRVVLDEFGHTTASHDLEPDHPEQLAHLLGLT